MRLRVWLRLAIILCCLAACRPATPAPAPPSTPPPGGYAIEQAVTLIPLAGDAARDSAEYSGMAWLGDTLLLLPQFPRRFEVGGVKGALAGIPRQAIEDYLDDRSSSPLAASMIPFDDGGLAGQLAGFEGFEALAVEGDSFYVTVETHGGNLLKNGLMLSWVARGRVLAGPRLVLDAATRRAIQPQTRLLNMGEESLLLWGDRVLTFYEANGPGVNGQPLAHAFNRELNPLPDVPFPALNYRVTDATPGTGDLAWVINYFSPTDTSLAARHDPLSARWGPPGAADAPQVERLVALQVNEQRIRLADLPPIRLKPGAQGRNWEGLTRLGERGFLMVTDTYPHTLLGFVPLPAASPQE